MKIRRAFLLPLVAYAALQGPVWAQSNPDEVQQFIDTYTSKYLDLYKVSSEAEWAANTLIIDGVEPHENGRKSRLYRLGAAEPASGVPSCHCHPLR